MLNDGERYGDMTDHHSYIHNLSSCIIKAGKNIHVWTEFEPMASAILMQFSTNLAIKPTQSWSFTDQLSQSNQLPAAW